MSTSEKTTEEVIQQTIDRFWETVPSTWNQIRANIRGIVTENFDISVEQFHILRHIRKGFCSVSELAQEKQISRPAISQTVEILVEKGLVVRNQSSQDRRIVRLQLTEKGDELLNAIFRMNRTWMEEQLSALDEADLVAIIHAMNVLKQTFGPPAN